MLEGVPDEEIQKRRQLEQVGLARRVRPENSGQHGRFVPANRIRKRIVGRGFGTGRQPQLAGITEGTEVLEFQVADHLVGKLRLRSEKSIKIAEISAILRRFRISPVVG